MDATLESLLLSAGVFANSTAGIFIVDQTGVIVQLNPAAEAITGYAASELLGHKPSMFNSGLHESGYFATIRDSLMRGEHWEGEIYCRGADTCVFPAQVSIVGLRNHAGELTHVVTSFTDITQKKATEERLRRLVYYDALTHLPNRTLFSEHLRQAIITAQMAGQLLAILYIDLDHFKGINDSLGHGAGDALLQGVARRLDNCVRSSDVVARIGGDEFAIMVGGLGSRGEAMMVANDLMRKVKDILSKPFEVLGRTVFSGCCIGVAIYPQDGDDSIVLQRNADTALYHAKSFGKNRHMFYTPEMNEEAIRNLELEHELRSAIAQNELYLVYQPLCEMPARRLIGVEALLRWKHPTLGHVSPATFIPVAESSGLIIDIGGWVLREACRQFCEWREQGCEIDYVSVNVSSRQFVAGDLISRVTEAMVATGMKPEHLLLELTESLLMEDVQYALDLLDSLRERGVRIAIDDFGTGYSSLSYLRQLPIDSLKIDRSFINHVPGKRSDEQIVRAVIAMAASMDLKVVAEGIETEEQLQWLQDAGCHTIQGFLLGKPQAPDQIATQCRR